MCREEPVRRWCPIECGAGARRPFSRGGSSHVSCDTADSVSNLVVSKKCDRNTAKYETICLLMESLVNLVPLSSFYTSSRRGPTGPPRSRSPVTVRPRRSSAGRPGSAIKRVGNPACSTGCPVESSLGRLKRRQAQSDVVERPRGYPNECHLYPIWSAFKSEEGS